MAINSKIKELRESKGWNQKDLAKKLGLTNAAISSYEREMNPITPSIKVLKNLAELFNISINEMIGRPDTEGSNKNIHEGSALKYFITENELSETDLAKKAKCTRNDFYYYYEKELIPLKAWEKLKVINLTRDKVISFFVEKIQVLNLYQNQYPTSQQYRFMILISLQVI